MKYITILRCECGSNSFEEKAKGSKAINIKCRKCNKEYNIAKVKGGYLMEEI